MFTVWHLPFLSAALSFSFSLSLSFYPVRLCARTAASEANAAGPPVQWLQRRLAPIPLAGDEARQWHDEVARCMNASDVARAACAVLRGPAARTFHCCHSRAGCRGTLLLLLENCGSHPDARCLPSLSLSLSLVFVRSPSLSRSHSHVTHGLPLSAIRFECKRATVVPRSELCTGGCFAEPPRLGATVVPARPVSRRSHPRSADAHAMRRLW